MKFWSSVLWTHHESLTYEPDQQMHSFWSILGNLSCGILPKKLFFNLFEQFLLQGSSSITLLQYQSTSLSQLPPSADENQVPEQPFCIGSVLPGQQECCSMNHQGHIPSPWASPLQNTLFSSEPASLRTTSRTLLWHSTGSPQQLENRWPKGWFLGAVVY